MTEPFQVPADGTIPYQYFTIPTNLTEDRWIPAIEFKPGDRRVVHHIIASSQPAGGNARDERTPGRTWARWHHAEQAGVVRIAPGVARLLKANSEIILQMHYTTVGEATSDRTSVAVIYAKKPPKKMVAGGNILNVRFQIPPGRRTTRSRERVFAEDTLLTR